MRILQVVPRFSPARGGGGVVIASNLAHGLANAGHEVEVCTSDYERSWEYIRTLKRGYTISWYHSILNIATMHITPNLILVARNAVRYLDVIHMQSCRTFQNIVVRYYALKYKIPYIVDAHGFSKEGTGIRRLFLSVFDACFGNRIVRDATFCIAETITGVAEYKRAGVDESKIVIMPCPYDLSVFDNLPPKGKFKQKYLLRGKKIILYLGGIEYIKGLDFLVKSFAKIKRDDVALVIVGADGGYKDTLKKMIKELGIEVLFTGYLEGDDKLEALVDADITVFPSRAEQGLPFAALESIMCDTPIIVADGTGAADDVRRMMAGDIVQFGNEDNLSKTIMYMLDNLNKSVMLEVIKMQCYIKANLSMSEKVKDYEELYKRCMG